MRYVDAHFSQTSDAARKSLFPCVKATVRNVHNLVHHSLGEYIRIVCQLIRPRLCSLAKLSARVCQVRPISNFTVQKSSNETVEFRDAEYPQ